MEAIKTGAARMNVNTGESLEKRSPPATVGRIVHFYSAGLNLNGQGNGPYPAIVTQVFGGPYANLKVLGWDKVWDEGSVSEKGSPHASAERYWEWPPRQ